MKHLAGGVAVFFIALFVYSKLAGPIPFSLTSVVTTKTDAFSVSGEGKVAMIPDIAIIHVGVVAQGTTVSRVQQELNAKMNAVITSVKKIGVDEKDVKTSNYTINPTYDYSNGDNRITGYQANSNLTIKVRKIDNANAVIDGATASGSNEVSGVTFDVDDKTKAENQARELAIKDARSKAEAAAKTAGFRLGRVINYSEGGCSGPRPMMYEATKALDSAQGTPTRVEPGTSEINITVTLSYEIL